MTTQTETAKEKQIPAFYMLDALHLARRELSQFYTPDQSEALRVVIAAIAKASRT
jgi:lipoprotein NlpI